MDRPKPRKVHIRNRVGEERRKERLDPTILVIRRDALQKMNLLGVSYDTADEHGRGDKKDETKEIYQE